MSEIDFKAICDGSGWSPSACSKDIWDLSNEFMAHQSDKDAEMMEDVIDSRNFG
ncbi:hypothetical protein [Rhizobium sp. MHM7A]|uniref:hypothetical protein n=1 Tax=Rhizobium sp. MHM7A TaxID=2583233 RepID=UPI001FF032F0|nr:hypothetical protein [Rhizobium sp. MHM7A]